MICAAVSGGSAISTSDAITSIIQTNSGIRDSVIPLQRMQIMVAITLIALAMLPMPLSEDAEDPVVGAVPARESPLRQRRVREPADVRRGAAPVRPSPPR